MKTIRDIMTPDPITIGPDRSLAEAIEMLVEYEISGLPVVAEDDKIVGVLSERDLLKTFQRPDARTVGDLMTADVVSISVDAPLVEVVDIIMSNDFRRVLIHDHGRIAGVVSRADLMPVILGMLGAEHAR